MEVGSSGGVKRRLGEGSATFCAFEVSICCSGIVYSTPKLGSILTVKSNLIAEA